MKLSVNLVLKGDENLEKKFLKCCTEKPNINLQLAFSLYSSLAVAFDLIQSDNVNIDFLRIAKIEEPPQIIVENTNLPVADNTDQNQTSENYQQLKENS